MELPPGRRPRPARRARLRNLATAAVLGVLAVGAPPALANPLVPITVFDPNQRVEWDFVRGLNRDQWAAAFAQRASQGFMVVDIEVHDTASCSLGVNASGCSVRENRYSAVFQRNSDGRAWRSLRDLPRARLLEEFQRALAENMNLVDIEVCTYFADHANPETRYAAVFIEDRENVAQWYGNLSLDREEGETEASLRLHQETWWLWIPIAIKEYHVPGCSRCFAVVYVANRDHLRWAVEIGLSHSEFATKFEQYRNWGYRMHTVSSQARYDCSLLGCGWSEHEAWNVYAGIWVENRDERGWTEYRNMTGPEFDQRYDERTQAGYRLIAFDAYKVHVGWVCTSNDAADPDCEQDNEAPIPEFDHDYNEFATRYAAVWRQNIARRDHRTD
jgi:hypothetical protein